MCVCVHCITEEGMGGMLVSMSVHMSSRECGLVPHVYLCAYRNWGAHGCVCVRVCTCIVYW